MISELRLLFFVSAIYFLLHYSGVFKQIDGIMKGHDELMIISAKVTSTVVILYLLIYFSKKQGITEGIDNSTNIRSFYMKMEEAVRKKAGSEIIKLAEDNTKNMVKWEAYGIDSQCNILMGSDKGDILGVAQCIKLRLINNSRCNILSLDKSSECSIKYIMDSIHILDSSERKNAYKIIKSESESDGDIVKKKSLSYSLDNLILSIQRDQNINVWIEYILESYRDILLPAEIISLESVSK